MKSKFFKKGVILLAVTNAGIKNRDEKNKNRKNVVHPVALTLNKAIQF